MIFRIFISVILIISSQAFSEIKLLTDRTESHLIPLIKQFEKETKIKVKTLFHDKGILNRFETRPGESDVILVKNAYILEMAKRKKLLQKSDISKIASELKPEFINQHNMYHPLSYRARVFFYNPKTVKPIDLGSYKDLMDPKWKGKICIRSGLHTYNISMFAQYAQIYGVPNLGSFIKGLKDNLARLPRGNDREQVKGIYEGKCQIAIANSYYMGIMLSRKDQEAWAKSSEVYFPDQQGKGTFVLKSAVGVSAKSKNISEAQKFIEYLLGDSAQTYFANQIFAYPVRKNIKLHEATAGLGRAQGIKNGQFKIAQVPLDEIVKNREIVIEMVNKIDFDGK